LPANTTLTLNGFIHFIVDPASINAQSTQVPEPSTWALALLGLAALKLVARRRQSAFPRA
jgi:MYXO-CTERM domain-containing protein